MSRRGWTQGELAARAGLELVDLTRVVNDVRGPSPRELEAIARALGRTIEELSTDGSPDTARVERS